MKARPRGVQLEAENARAQAENRSQGTRTDQLPTNSRRLGKQGPDTKERLLRRLARTNRDILERYEKGESGQSAGSLATSVGLHLDELLSRLRRDGLASRTKGLDVSSIASRMLASASSRVYPCLWQPGSAGMAYRVAAFGFLLKDHSVAHFYFLRWREMPAALRRR